MEKKFKQGDRVYHKKLKQYGVFLGYAWESDEESYGPDALPGKKAERRLAGGGGYCLWQPV